MPRILACVRAHVGLSTEHIQNGISHETVNNNYELNSHIQKI